MARTQIDATLTVTSISKWPYYRVEVLGPRSSAAPGQLQIPLALDIDSRLLRQKADPVKVVVDAGEAVGVIVGKVQA